MYEYTFSCELPKICRNDLIVLNDKKANKAFGGCSNILLCTKVSTAVHLLDITNFNTIMVS